MTETKKGQVEGQTGEETQDNQKGQTGEETQSQQASQPLDDNIEVELPDGSKATLGELKKSPFFEKDYRKKTAELAEERRRLEAEKRMRNKQPEATSPDSYGEDGEPEEPYTVLAKEVAGLKAAYAHDFLKRSIRDFQTKYPDADVDAVFNTCWANPYNTEIEEEMQRSHTRVQERISKVPQFKTEEEQKAYNKRVIEEYNAKKKQGQNQAGGFASGSETVNEPLEPPKTDEECKEKFQEMFEEGKE